MGEQEYVHWPLAGPQVAELLQGSEWRDRHLPAPCDGPSSLGPSSGARNALGPYYYPRDYYYYSRDYYYYYYQSLVILVGFSQMVAVTVGGDRFSVFSKSMFMRSSSSSLKLLVTIRDTATKNPDQRCYSFSISLELTTTFTQK
jgi:hypothetical protein